MHSHSSQAAVTVTLPNIRRKNNKQIVPSIYTDGK